MGDLIFPVLYKKYVAQKFSLFFKLFYFQFSKKNDLEDSTRDANSLALFASVHTSGFSSGTISGAFWNFFGGSSAQIAKSTFTFAAVGRYGYSVLTKMVLASINTLGETLTETRKIVNKELILLKGKQTYALATTGAAATL